MRRRPIRVSAPVRLDFAGAWTDVAPFAQEQRGVVVNAAIDLRTRVDLRSIDAGYRLRADDLDEQVDASSIEEFSQDGRLALLKAAIRRFGVGPCELRTAAEAPAGSGLGTSGALSVTLARAMMASGDSEFTAHEVAHAAWQLETVDAAVAGGQQDQYAAALGGFQLLEFDKGKTTATSLRIDDGFARHLAAHTVICYTGKSRFSGETITRVMNSYRAGDPIVTRALRSLVVIAEAMAPALEAGELELVGSLLARNWREQQQLAPGMCTAEMARLETAMMAAGAVGGKAAGSGAGGSMFFIVPGRVEQAIAAAEALGAVVLPTRWADRGVSVD